jgi:hypothetical protein
MHPPGIGDHIFGKAAGRRGHHPVAGLDTPDIAADRLDLAGTLQAEPRADAAEGTVLMTRGNQKIGPVEARGPHSNQYLVRFRCGLRQFAHFDAFFT